SATLSAVPLMLRDAHSSQACAGCVNLPALRLLSMRARESSRGLRTRGELHPTPLPHAAMAGFGEGHVADTGSEIARERRAGCDMTQERLPSDTVGVAVVRERRRRLPALAVIGGDVLHHAEMR